MAMESLAHIQMIRIKDLPEAEVYKEIKYAVQSIYMSELAGTDGSQDISELKEALSNRLGTIKLYTDEDEKLMEAKLENLGFDERIADLGNYKAWKEVKYDIEVLQLSLNKRISLHKSYIMLEEESIKETFPEYIDQEPKEMPVNIISKLETVADVRNMMNKGFEEQEKEMAPWMPFNEWNKYFKDFQKQEEMKGTLKVDTDPSSQAYQPPGFWMPPLPYSNANMVTPSSTGQVASSSVAVTSSSVAVIQDESKENEKPLSRVGVNFQGGSGMGIQKQARGFQVATLKVYAMTPTHSPLVMPSRTGQVASSSVTVIQDDSQENEKPLSRVGVNFQGGSRSDIPKQDQIPSVSPILPRKRKRSDSL